MHRAHSELDWCFYTDTVFTKYTLTYTNAQKTTTTTTTILWNTQRTSFNHLKLFSKSYQFINFIYGTEVNWCKQFLTVSISLSGCLFAEFVNLILFVNWFWLSPWGKSIKVCRFCCQVSKKTNATEITGALELSCHWLY